ncbi:MAG: hypothetical protein AB8F65_10130 [Woeseiaceae bacterium]
MKRFLLTTTLLLASACSVGQEQRAVDQQTAENAGPTFLGELDFSVLPEASGMAVSYYDSNRIWFINDQGNSASLIAVSTTDMQHDVLKVKGVKNRDWEELAGFELDGQPWLLIADVGDNKAVRDEVRLIFVKEPKSPSDGDKLESMSITMTYPDGPRDVEAIAVDASRDAIFILSKRTKPPILYSLGLKEAMMQARSGTKTSVRPMRLGDVLTIPAPTELELKLFPKYGIYRNQPTSMDLSRDGQTIALMTYGETYLIKLAPGQSWMEAFAGELRPIGMPILPQPETVAFGPDGNLFISTERERAPLYRFSPGDAKP